MNVASPDRDFAVSDCSSGSNIVIPDELANAVGLDHDQYTIILFASHNPSGEPMR